MGKREVVQFKNNELQEMIEFLHEKGFSKFNEKYAKLLTTHMTTKIIFPIKGRKEKGTITWT